MSEQMCAHLHVEYHTLQNLDGTTYGWWQCDDCETKFVPEGRVAQLEEELAGFREIRDNSNGVVGWHLNGSVATWDELEDALKEVE